MAMSASSTPRPLTASNVVPPTQNTAPVLEFRCLYTPDVRRKQKRWQDGRLKYHTFNKRVMIYDERSNFIGDTHWREDYTFEEGEEVELERNGMLVQVCECVGRREQDLTELLDKGLKERVERRYAREVASSSLQLPPGSRLQWQAGSTSQQLRSPLSRLQEQASPLRRIESSDPPPPAKRRRLDSAPPSKSGYAQNLTGATLSLSLPPMSSAPRRQDPLWARTSKQQQQVESIDLTGDDQPRYGVVTKTKQTTKRSEKPHLERDAYARNITGPVLTVSGQALSRDVVTATKHPGPAVACSQIAEPQKVTLTMVSEGVVPAGEDEFVDIETFDTPKSRGAKEPSHQHAKVMATTPQPPASAQRVDPSAKIFLRQPNIDSRTKVLQDEELPRKSHGEQPSNPLRLKSRPKKTLLYMSDPQCWSSAATGKWTKSPAPTAGSEEVQSAAPDQGFSLTRERLRDYRLNLAKTGDPRDSGSKPLPFGSEIGEAPQVYEGVSDSLREDGNPQTRIPSSEQLLPMISLKPEVCLMAREQQIHTSADGDGQLMNMDDKPPHSFRGGTTSGREVYYAGKAHFVQRAKSVVQDDDCSPAMECGIDHLAIDAIHSRHIPPEPIRTMRTVRTSSRQPKGLTSIAEVTLPPSQNWCSISTPPKTSPSKTSTSSEVIGSSADAIPLSKKMNLPLQRKEVGDDKITNGSVESAKSAGLSTTKAIETSFAKKSSPRLVKTSNKRARSKEVAGFVLPMEEALTSIQASQRMINRPPERDIQKNLQTLVKLANPATRGRKAASKADAAGKVPETVVPPVAPMAPPPRLIARKLSPHQDDDLSSVPNYISTKDGEGTGPWSREAFDLFDWRPSVAGIAEIG